MQLFSSWTGGDFLLFYTMLLAMGSVAAWWIPVHLRSLGRPGESADFESLAVLAGGRERLADSLLADLFVRGALKVGAGGKLVVMQPRMPTSPAGQELLAITAPFSLAAARKRIGVHAERVAARLRRSGLLMRPEELTRLKWLSVAPFVALLMLGLYRHRAGAALGEPTGWLTGLLVVTVGLAVYRFRKIDPRTQAGIAAVERARARSSRLARAPQAEEAALAVALFGSAVLVGTPWEPVHALRQQGSGDGGGSASGSDGDGGSGCGGGCGGCGG